jgi:hypothetical protein
VWLIAKEWRALMASRPWWIMLALIGPLVGVCFTNAVRSFAEVSQGAGAGCGIVCDPLVGVWAPTLSGYEAVAIFLLPFVAIRQVSDDRRSGAFKLELQRPFPAVGRILAKAAALAGGWLIGSAALLIAIVLWASYGGRVDAASLAVAVFGQWLNAGLTIALAVAVASIAEHPSTAAIITLAVTVGTWVLALVASIYGGLWQRLSELTPTALLSMSQHGLLQSSVTTAITVFIVTGLCIAAVWTRLGTPISRRVVETIGIAGVACLAAWGGQLTHASADLSEGRLNSFAKSEEEALARLPGPLTIEAHLAPQDPRRLELERGAFAKLRRVLPGVHITYMARTTSGLYEQADPGYGELWYQVGGHREMNRAVTDESVLETIFSAGGISPHEENDVPYLGRPLVAQPVGASWLFYGVWPLGVAVAGFFAMKGTR